MLKLSEKTFFFNFFFSTMPLLAISKKGIEKRFVSMSNDEKLGIVLLNMKNKSLYYKVHIIIIVATQGFNHQVISKLEKSG